VFARICTGGASHGLHGSRLAECGMVRQCGVGVNGVCVCAQTCILESMQMSVRYLKIWAGLYRKSVPFHNPIE